MSHPEQASIWRLWNELFVAHTEIVAADAIRNERDELSESGENRKWVHLLDQNTPGFFL